MKKLLIILSFLLVFNSCSDDEEKIVCDYRYEVWEQRDLNNCEVTEYEDCVFYVLISDEDVEGCYSEEGLLPLGHDRLYYKYVNNVDNPRR